MSRIPDGHPFATAPLKASVALFSLALVLLFPQAGRAQSEPLTFFKNYFITGDYVVGGTSLWRKGVHGVANVDVEVKGVPANVDVVAAFLYVQTAERTAGSGISHAAFRGQNLDTPGGSIAKALSPSGAPWWGYRSPGWRKMVTYRADVLRFLPIDNTTGRQVVNGLHHIQVPDTGSDDDDDEDGDGQAHEDCLGPHAVGASLVLVYRDPTLPLTAIVIYDGLATKRSAETWTQPIQGFYQAASSGPVAKMTHIVGGGRAYLSEKVTLDGALSPNGINPFVGGSGPRWDNTRFAATLPGDASSATVRVEPDPSAWKSDALSWSALIFSTTVQDSDGDGLLNIWEGPNTLLDPNGQSLPDLAGMGATPNQKDVFIEIGYMTADQDTPYGAVRKPAHTHLPALQALKMVGDAFKNAPDPIRVHFDVGPNYQVDPDTSLPSPYIIPAGLARGGDVISETAGCTTTAVGEQTCPGQFPLYPGTVGWKTGFAFLRDALISLHPLPLDPVTGDDPCDAPGNDGLGSDCERRFDRNRSQTFRYALFAHAIGLPKDPCLKKNPDGTEVSPAESDLSCDTPDFHVPRSNSGVGDFPGGDVMVTLGAFSDAGGRPVGTPFMQGSTLMHELGHTYELTHAGTPTIPQEPNCKPNYLSVMNYLFQLRGLFNDTQPGVPHMDFSAEVLGGLNESSLSDGFFASGTPRYHTGWYAPSGPGTFGSPAKKYCTGADYPVGAAPMVRVDSARVAGLIDWNPNPGAANAAFEQDINFDGITSSLNQGTNDWVNLHSNQLGSRRNVGAFFTDNQGRLVMGPLSLDVGRGDIGRGDIGRGDIGRGDIGRGDIGRGDIGRGDIGRGDIGRGDIGRGDIGRGDIGAADELDFEIATAAGNTPPTELSACVIGVGTCAGDEPSQFHRNRLDWKPPTVGSVFQYKVYRGNGDSVTPLSAQLVGAPVVAQTDVTAYHLIDNQELPNALFTYFVVAEFADADHTVSGPSNFVTILAINDAPVARNDAPVANPNSYTINQGTSLATGAPGVLGNDTDADSPSLTAAIVQPPAHAASFAFNPGNGSFTYTPDPSFVGTDTFTYTANDVDPGRSSNVATVSIIVVAVGYELVNVKNLPPPAGATFKKGSLVDFEWRFKKGGVVVNSRDALPSVTIVGPDSSVPTRTYTPSACDGSTFTYDAVTNMWDFDWKPKIAKAGTYYVTVKSGKTGQQFPTAGPGFAVVVK